MNKPFKERVINFWNAFSQEEAEVRSMMDNKADSESLLSFVESILSIAFNEIYFEMGINGDNKYELILTPEGNKTKWIQIDYWLKMAPQQLSEKWNFYSSKPAIGDENFEFGMYDISVKAKEVVIACKTDTERRKIDLEVHAPKLMGLDENKRYSMFFILLDQFIGEINTMQNIGYIDFVETEPEGNAVTIDKLKAIVNDTVKENEWSSADEPLGTYSSYQLEPNRNEGWVLREDIFIGSTVCVPALNAFLKHENDFFEEYEKNGMVYGFLFYDNTDVPREEIVPFRGEIEDKILAAAAPQRIADGIGGATGFRFSYMDFIIYDKEAFLKIAKDVLSTYKMSEKGYCNLVYGAQPDFFN